MNQGPSGYRTFLWFIAVVGPLVAVLLCYEFLYRYPIWAMRAFRVPSASMCPTICSGERIFVEMQYGRPYLPKRDDVVMLDYGADHALFLKRIIGLPGDVVAAGPRDTMLVNGKPWQAPPACAKSLLVESNGDRSAYSGFEETQVQPGQLFVVGDNLSNSFDSRVAQFEPVTPAKIIGRPLMIYWSRERARIGCPVR